MSGESTDTWLIDDLIDKDDSETQCKLCRGAKFVHPLLDNGKPDYRKIVPCICTTNKVGAEKFARLLQYSNLGSLSRLNFDSLLPEGRKVEDKIMFNFKHAFMEATKFASSPHGWLIFTGPSGCGKTHLACAIANHQIKQSKQVFYIEVADLIDYIFSSLDNNDLKYSEFFDQVKNVPLLIMDDLDLSIHSEWAKSKIQQILNHRFNEQLPTVITSSIPVSLLEEKLNGHLTDPEFCVVCRIEPHEKLALEHFCGMGLELIQKMSFKNFDYKRINLSVEERQNLEQVYRLSFNFAQNPQGWLVLLGDNGCGKTHLAASIANYLKENNKDVLFVVVPDFLDYLRSAFSPDRRISYDEIFEKVKKAPILILDDFGEQAITQWTQEKLYQLINYRYNARLATVITTCFAFDDIESRISSRMVDPSLSLVFNIAAPDYRGDRKRVTKKYHQGIKRTNNG